MRHEAFEVRRSLPRWASSFACISFDQTITGTVNVRRLTCMKHDDRIESHRDIDRMEIPTSGKLKCLIIADPRSCRAPLAEAQLRCDDYCLDGSMLSQNAMHPVPKLQMTGRLPTNGAHHEYSWTFLGLYGWYLAAGKAQCNYFRWWSALPFTLEFPGHQAEWRALGSIAFLWKSWTGQRSWSPLFQVSGLPSRSLDTELNVELMSSEKEGRQAWW